MCCVTKHGMHDLQPPHCDLPVREVLRRYHDERKETIIQLVGGGIRHFHYILLQNN